MATVLAQSQTPIRSSERGPLVLTLVSAVLIVGALITAGVLITEDRSFTLDGELTLTDTHSSFPFRHACSGQGIGFGDIDTGTAVTVRDAEGTVLATGRLRPGVNRTGGPSCVFPFTVPDVPVGSQFYSVEVANRGEVQFGRDDLDRRGAQLSLGS